MWCIMRSDYSAVLMVGDSYLWRTKHNAQKMATSCGGHVVRAKVAKKVLTINRMIGRNKDAL